MARTHALGSEPFGLHKGNEKRRECIALAAVTYVADLTALRANCARERIPAARSAHGRDVNGAARENGKRIGASRGVSESNGAY